MAIEELIENNKQLWTENNGLRDQIGELRARAAQLDQDIRNALTERFGIEVPITVPLPEFIRDLS